MNRVEPPVVGQNAIGLDVSPRVTPVCVNASLVVGNRSFYLQVNIFPQ
ncbi:hypothetical protein [Chryseobacterium lathyri]|nr:hypothetical protein [Chryseobacterium lathyri]